MDDLKFLLPYQAHMYFSMNTFSVLVWENTKCAMNVWNIFLLTIIICALENGV